MEVGRRRLSRSVHVVTAAVVLDGHDGLCSLRILCKLRPCAKLTGMIDAGRMPVRHVSVSHQIDYILHEVIIFIILGQRLLESCTLCSESETSVENCVLSV